ncbi:MAG: hypothetical protein J5U19_00805 [Candidatus Methanoperedens sp.]|nr:hypothetical protein [Candidatus Methanoperedens sp.]
MVKETEERKDINEGNKDIFKTWEDSYTAISKMWEDSYLKLYKPWLGSKGELFEKAVELSKEATPQKYQEFYEEWLKTYQNTCGDFYEIPTVESSKETFEKLLVSAEDSNKIYRSWITNLEENSRATRDVLKGEPDPAKYKEVYDMWIKSYGKIFDELLTLPFRQNIKEIFEKLTGAPDIYSNTFEQILKIWNDSYAKLYRPWIDSMLKISAKSSEISGGNASPEAYKEFYTLWQNTYQETYGKLFDIQSKRPSKEVLEYFVRSANVNLNIYKSWIATLEKLSQKAKELSKQNADPETYKEFYSLWAKTYEKAFENFFESTPTVSPFKEIFEPVKNAAKIYVDTFTGISRNWMKSYPISASAV